MAAATRHGIVLLAGMFVLLWQPAAAQPPLDFAPIPPGLQTANSQKLGALSCAATACHGSVTRDNRPGNIWRNEHVQWIENDPHAGAFDTLSSDRSRVMLDKLNIEPTTDDKGYQNCLACHGPSPPPDERGPNYHVGFGVDCESCHGPASDWLSTHYLPSFSSAGTAMVNTKDVKVRAQLCAKCHVGSADREVNHDLIAAGHPALKFELAAYLDMLPKHWDQSQLRHDNQDFETQLWQAGQIASAAASLNLLVAQADRAVADEQATWPEFAQYDCYACHHDLVSPAWRQQRGYSDRKPGTIPWGSWYFRISEYAHHSTGTDDATSKLRTLMQSGFRPEPAAVRDAAQDVISQLPATWDALPSNRLQQKLISNPPVAANWDIAAQTYLMMIALQQAAINSGSADIQTTRSLRDLRHGLAFPHGFDSPRSFVGGADLKSTSANPQQTVQTLIDQILARWQQRSELSP